MWVHRGGEKGGPFIEQEGALTTIGQMAQLYHCRPSIWFPELDEIAAWLVDYHTFEHLALNAERRERKDRGARRAKELADKAAHGN